MSTTTSTSTAGVRIIKVFNYTTDNSVKELEKHIRFNLVQPERFTKARLDYNAHVGPTAGTTEEILDNPGYYPLKFSTQDGSEEVWVSCVTCGYRGTGPWGALKCLEMMGFHLTQAQEDAFHTIKVAHHKYTK